MNPVLSFLKKRRVEPFCEVAATVGIDRVALHSYAMTELPQENRQWLTIIALLGASAVGLGAWGSHGLRHWVSPELLSVWRTGVEYQMFHTLAALAIAVGARGLDCWRWTLRLWVLGIGLFSGSLYALVLSDWRLLGIVTPFGGLSLIGGWFGLAFAARNRISASP